MRHVCALVFCTLAFPLAGAGFASAEPLKSGKGVGILSALPVIEVEPAIVVMSPNPGDVACSPFTCSPGGRRIPSANPEGDVFPTGQP
jgi:hypothetical protein